MPTFDEDVPRYLSIDVGASYDLVIQKLDHRDHDEFKLRWDGEDRPAPVLLVESDGDQLEWTVTSSRLWKTLLAVQEYLGGSLEGHPMTVEAYLQDPGNETSRRYRVTVDDDDDQDDDAEDGA